jgi:adenylate kinase family enzyme
MDLPAAADGLDMSDASRAPRFVLLGNSGSGKTTLAAWLGERHGIDVLDLDSVAWEPGQIAVPRDERSAQADVLAFCSARPGWVVEGCYANLVEVALGLQPQLLFLNPGVEACIEHCQRRPHEPHKYASKDEQDARLAFLLQWVREYPQREDAMSLRAHRACFEAYRGPKREFDAPLPLPLSANALFGLPAAPPPGADPDA